MQKTRIGLLDFENAVTGLLDEEVKIVKKNADKIAKQTAKETVEVVKESANFKNKTGKYIKSIKTSTEKGDVSETVYVISAETDGQYRLTHLLEDGHSTVIKHGIYGKKRSTRAFPHFSKGAEYADRRIDELVEEIVNENK